MERELRYNEKVNELLAENASIWANLGTGSKMDLGTDEAATSRWQEILDEITSIDKELGDSLT